jgi:hypothetical protein
MKMSFELIKSMADEDPLSVDLYLYKLSQNKQNQISEFIEILKKASIESNRC